MQTYEGSGPDRLASTGYNRWLFKLKPFRFKNRFGLTVSRCKEPLNR